MNLSADWLRELVTESAAETETLEFKYELPRTKEHAEKAEFAKDIVAMANGDGGVILYGVGESKGCASSIMPVKSETADAAQRRLEQVLQGAVEPKELRVKFESIPYEDGYVLAAIVPKSYSGPHRVIADNKSHFYVRSNAHVKPLSYNELKTAFIGQGRASDEFRKWRSDRLAAIKDGRGARPMPRGLALAVVHVCPLESFERTINIDPTQFRAEPRKLMHGTHTPNTYCFNLDGIVAYYQSNDIGSQAYGQFFRSGRLEQVAVAGELRQDGRNHFTAKYVVYHVRNSLQYITDLFRDMGFGGPLVYSLAILKLEGFGIPTIWSDMYSADRSELVLPEIVIDESVENVDELARPLLDMLWQCFGQASCPYFDPDTGAYRDARQE